MNSTDLISKIAVDLGEKLPPAQLHDISNVKYHYVASYLIDIRAQDDVELLDTNYVAVTGYWSNDSYYSECITEEDVGNILSLVEEDEMPIGMFRYVVAGTCGGGSYQTQDGVEYDAWQNFDLLSRTQLTEDEEACTIHGFEEEHKQWLQLQRKLMIRTPLEQVKLELATYKDGMTDADDQAKQIIEVARVAVVEAMLDIPTHNGTTAEHVAQRDIVGYRTELIDAVNKVLEKNDG